MQFLIWNRWNQEPGFGDTILKKGRLLSLVYTMRFHSREGLILRTGKFSFRTVEEEEMTAWWQERALRTKKSRQIELNLNRYTSLQHPSLPNRPKWKSPIQSFLFQMCIRWLQTKHQGLSLKSSFLPIALFHSSTHHKRKNTSALRKRVGQWTIEETAFRTSSTLTRDTTSIE